ncbi:MAG: diguanylate cyclase [Ignavibacteriales bacterium]
MIDFIPSFYSFLKILSHLNKLESKLVMALLLQVTNPEIRWPWMKAGMDTIRILVIEDDKIDRMAFERFVKDENPPYDYTMTGSISEVKKILEFKRFDIVITDYMLGDGTAFDIFDLIKDTPIIILTGSGNEKIAIEAMKAGACDYLIKDSERNYFKILPVTVENTLRHKRVEKQFNLLSHALTSINDSVYVTDMDGKMIFVNKTFCEMYGYEQEDIIGMDSNVLGESDWKGEFYHKRKDESELPVSLTRSIVQDEHGKQIAIVGVGRDITEQKRLEKELFRLASIPQQDPSPIIEVEVSGSVIYLNPAAQAQFPDLQELGIGHPILEGLRSTIDAFRNGEQKSFTCEINLDNKVYGQKLWYTSENNLIRIYMADITERKRAEETIQKANEQLTISVKQLELRNHNTTLLNEMGDLLQTCLTVEEAYTIISKFAEQLFPAESGLLYMLNVSEDLLEIAAAWGESQYDEDVFRPNECWALRRGHVYIVNDPRAELLCQHLNHSPSAGYLCVPLMAQGKYLGMLHLQNSSNGMKQPEEILGRLKESTKQQLVLSMAEHISLALANLKLRETLHNLAIRDPLTGLFNRRYLEESLRRELHRAKRKGTPLGVVMLDLDHFKQFNDTFGHAAGDALLHELGSFLQTHTRKEDIVCRYGGEEFLLILPDTSLDDTRDRAEQLREEFKHLRVQYNGQSIKAATVSLGVAVFPEHGSTADVILGVADAALYRAKREGRDREMVGQAVEENRPASLAFIRKSSVT